MVFRIMATVDFNYNETDLRQDISIGSVFFYSRSVTTLGASRAAVFAALVPGVAVILAYPDLGERPPTLEIYGLRTVTIGVTGALGLWKIASRFRLGRKLCWQSPIT